MGAGQGLIVTAFNHLKHAMGDPTKPKYYNKKPAYDKNNPLQEHYNEAVTLAEWENANKGLTRDQIINQTENRSSSPLNSQQGGPKLRYVFHPRCAKSSDFEQQ